ncbi:MFS transporter [Streptomyces sp. MnatMP-M17]|uniref:MFS transporter n=1 Tax=unclassified Streptomyces TaxID=2593676 RepID=UPI000B88548A|nr:MFS transporter [Streptomyces sp. MnatMP-M17]MYZ35617.1 MFS transporter [Streptomyces sp. SID4917]
MPHLNKVGTAVSGGDDADLAARSSLSRLRTALTVFFALDGFMFAGWVVRIPAIKDQTGASESDLGLALLGVSAGAVVTMVFTGRLCQRFGSHPVTVVSAVLLSLSIVLPPQAHSAPALGLVLLVFGAAYGSLNVSMNSAAVDLVAALRRPVISSFHAAFSLGGMVGAGLGGLVAGGLSPTVHLLLLTGVGLLVTAVTGPVLLRRRAPVPLPVPVAVSGPGAEAGAAHTPRGRGRGTRRVVLLFGVIALCTAYGEGAMADWSALHLTEDLDASPGLAAAGYSLFALAMTAGRLSGTVLLERLGQNRALVLGGLTAALGMLLGALAPTAWAALTGFAVAGLGLANIFPVAVGRAGALAGPGGVATASTLGYGGMLLGPPAIGFLADWFSLPLALTTVALLAAAAAVIAHAARHVSAEPAPQQP